MNMPQKVKVFISAPLHDPIRTATVTARYNGSEFYMIPYHAYKKAWEKLCGHSECEFALVFMALDKRLCTVAVCRDKVTFHASELRDDV